MIFEHLENCCQRFWNPLPLKGIKPHLAIQRYSLVAMPQTSTGCYQQLLRCLSVASAGGESNVDSVDVEECYIQTH
jgi:hypothetical protein